MYSPRQIIELLRVGNNIDSVKFAVEQLAQNGGVPPVMAESEQPSFADRRRSATTTVRKTVSGVVDMTRTGDAYVVTAKDENDVFVPARSLYGAMKGDTVEVSISPRSGRRPEGRIERVLERAAEYFIGTLYVQEHIAVVVPDRKDVPDDIYVGLDDLKEAEHGDFVVVKVLSWPSRSSKMLRGKVTTVLGKPGGHHIEMNGILINNGFNLTFPDDVLAETAEFSSEVMPQDVAERLDLRGIPTFTIDPADAKDFDDALSIRFIDEDNIEIGVHIADVTHYVKPNTALDKEAYLRSTSVYLVDRVCPMLPERLSNELCSLRPNEDKFTFSAMFVMNEDGQILKRWFGKTIIHSQRRFSYEEAQDVLDTKQGDYAAQLTEMNRLAHILRKQRYKDGAISFEDEEVRFRLEEGEPVDVYVKSRKDAHMLIEDFMLLANREVATYIQTKAKGQEIPYLYRIHDTPDIAKLEDFARFAAEMGQKMDLQTPKKIAQSFNRLTKEVATNPALKLLMPLAIRTMAKAVYSTNNIGHYGLAFEYYSHFTSPIRRYADVLAHRILFENLEKRTMRFDKDTLDAQCLHISNQEKKASMCERESTKYFQTIYMQKHVGDTFDGVVSGMIERGLFVEMVGSRAEGFVPFDRIRHDSFSIDAARMRATGARTGQIMRMGEPIRVKIISVDTAQRKIELTLVS